MAEALPAKPSTSKASGKTKKGRAGLDLFKYGTIQSLQAVVLAGGSGSRMNTLVTNTPKWRLPVATIPMLYYPLRMLQSSGFKECIVVIDQDQESAVREMAKSYGLTIHMRFYHDAEVDRGTLDAMRHISSAFSEAVDDVLIVSGDLISDVNIEDMMHNHRIHKSVLTMLVAEFESMTFVDAPGAKPRFKTIPDALMELLEDKRLCYSSLGSDIGDAIELTYPKQRHGQIGYYRGPRDLHGYIISGKLFRDYVLSSTSPCARMSSFRAEVIPHLIDMQFQEMRHAEYDAAVVPIEGSFAALKLSHIRKSFMSTAQLLHWAASGCRTYCHSEGVSIRADTVSSFWHANTKLLPALLPMIAQCHVKVGDHSKSEVQPKAVVKGNTLLRDGCVLSDRTTVTDSSFGLNCVVKPRCRVTNSVIFDNVTLEPGTVVEGSIVCCSIDKENCKIKNCIVAASDSLKPDGEVEGDTFEASRLYEV